MKKIIVFILALILMLVSIIIVLSEPLWLIDPTIEPAWTQFIVLKLLAFAGIYISMKIFKRIII